MAGRALSRNTCVYSHIGLLIDHRCDHIGRFTSYAGKLEQVLPLSSALVPGTFPSAFCHADQVPGFIVRIRDASDQGKNHQNLLCSTNRDREFLKNKGVVRLTRLSVHCAERITATNSWKGLS